jgi:gliding motility-associated-like protein
VQTGSISLSVSGGKPDYHFNWSNGETRSELSNLAAGDYAVTVSDANNCTASSDFTVGINYNLQVSISGQNTVVNGQPVQLDAEANVDHSNVYSWTPSAYLTCGTCNVTEAQPAETSLFTVSVTDMNGCTAMDTITIDVDSRTSIFIPNAFSPNNDGNNDLFHVYGELSGVRYFELVVFDRWGEKVYETNDYASGWDGQFRGQPAPVGTYVYVATVTFADGTEKNYKGSVNLFR